MGVIRLGLQYSTGFRFVPKTEELNEVSFFMNESLVDYLLSIIGFFGHQIILGNIWAVLIFVKKKQPNDYLKNDSEGLELALINRH